MTTAATVPGTPAADSGSTEGPATRELLPVATAARTRRVVAGLLAPRRARALLTAAVFVAQALAGLAGPLALGRIVDAVQHHRGDGPVTAAAAVLLAAALAQGALTALGTALTTQVGEEALADLRERVIDRAFTLPAQRVEQVGAGDLAARIGDDAALTATAVRSVLPAVAGAALTIGLTVLGLAALDWRLALAGLCALPIQLGTLRWYLRHSGPLYAAQRAAGSERSRQILESVSGAETVLAFRLAREHTARIDRRSAAAVRYAMRAVTLRSRFYGRLNAAEFTGLALVLTAGCLLVRDGRVGVGDATAAALLFIRLFDPFNIVLGLVGTLQEAGAALARLVGAADLAAGDPAPAPIGPPAAGHLAAVRDVHHAYTAGEPVLRGVTLALAPGEHVTLVGASGAGKSTLARIVAGVHPPTSGQVTLAPPRAAGRPAVVLLDQDTHVFADTVAGNLRLARPGAPDDALRDALDRAGALPWVTALPDGLGTAIGAGAHRLTPVQEQQLALARLVLADPQLAVLDESAAEAGSEGARTLEAAARRALTGRTALVVAHRLSQAVTADRILVMEAGRIVEEGTHAELAAANGRYARLWEAWSQRTARGGARPAPTAPAP